MIKAALQNKSVPSLSRVLLGRRANNEALLQYERLSDIRGYQTRIEGGSNIHKHTTKGFIQLDFIYFLEPDSYI